MTECITDVVKAVEIVKAIQERQKTLTFWTANDQWAFDTENDNDVCSLCTPFNNQIFSGDLVKDVFPNATIKDDMTLYANVHMPRDPNCRCVLNRVVRVGETYYYVQRKP
jgi:hypothetical protein